MEEPEPGSNKSVSILGLKLLQFKYSRHGLFLSHWYGIKFTQRASFYFMAYRTFFPVPLGHLWYNENGMGIPFAALRHQRGNTNQIVA